MIKGERARDRETGTTVNLNTHSIYHSLILTSDGQVLAPPPAKRIPGHIVDHVGPDAQLGHGQTQRSSLQQTLEISNQCLHIRIEISEQCLHIHTEISEQCLHIRIEISEQCLHIRIEICEQCLHIRIEIQMTGIQIQDFADSDPDST